MGAMYFGLMSSCSVSKETHAQAAPFIQGNISIVPPVTVKRGEKGFALDFLQDGGTKMVTIIDARGNSFDLWMYHRFGREIDWGFYLNDRPGHKGSVRIMKEAEFKRKILHGVLQWDKKSGNVLLR